jgi:probable F420-dependent oxidoreductase
VIDVARRCEALGYESVWAGDHLAYPTPYIPRFGPVFYEALTSLAAVAVATRRIRLGTGVLILPYRHPLHAARALATLDHFSGGRLIFGAGVGWCEEEFRNLGAPFEARGRATDECLRAIREMWTRDPASFQGELYRFTDVVSAPRPVQQPAPPVWIGGNTRRAVRRAAELGDGWMPTFHKPTGRGYAPDALREELARLRDLARQAGRGRAALTAAGMMPMAILNRSARGDEAQPLIGTPDEIRAYLRAYRAAGMDTVILNAFYGLPATVLVKDVPQLLRGLGRFAREIMPEFAEKPTRPGARAKRRAAGRRTR